MNLNDAELAALESGRQRIGVFFRLDTDPVVRLWLGFGKIHPGVNAYDLTGAVYRGFGELLNPPAFKQLINGKAERVDFTISGVSGDILGIASGGDSGQVKGKRVAVGFAIMASDWSLLGAVKWCANYTADYLAIQQAVTDDPMQPIVRTVTLSCGTIMTGRRRPSYSYFTNQDQQARFPGDRFCERTPVYANGFNKTWPTFPPPPPP
jgi:hypothetical protein